MFVIVTNEFCQNIYFVASFFVVILAALVLTSTLPQFLPQVYLF